MWEGEAGTSGQRPTCWAWQGGVSIEDSQSREKLLSKQLYSNKIFLKKCQLKMGKLEIRNAN